MDVLKRIQHALHRVDFLLLVVDDRVGERNRRWELTRLDFVFGHGYRVTMVLDHLSGKSMLASRPLAPAFPARNAAYPGHSWHTRISSGPAFQNSPAGGSHRSSSTSLTAPID